LKDTCNRSELRFSQWLEALRKDVECTFGILKGRWRILKTGIRVHNTEVSDNIWITYCALHNLLLDVDGLSHKWEDGFPSSYEADDGEFQDEDIPAVIRRLVDPTGIKGHRLRTFDSSQLVQSGTSVKAIEFHRFRAMLIDNSNIAFHENQLKWPKRFSKDLKPVPILTSSSTSTNLHLYFEPIIQVLDFTNELLSSKFQVPGPGALVGERGT
jgi:hypothetical protein